ncbi:hypothetical protein COO60DRAFT_1089462 [Scenedesmus sp. NREL 46B-D3]|nr:hypothetical protein COO60DRAFT_1089462 [Scenedesmus sp. NREL 46B-D3]
MLCPSSQCTRTFPFCIFDQSLGNVLQVGPADWSPLVAPPLAQQLDASWWAINAADAAAELIDESGVDQQQHDTAADAPTALQQPPEFHWPVDQQQQPLQPQAMVSVIQQPPTVTTQQQEKQQQQQQHGKADHHRLLVAGLELPANLSKRGLQGSMGWGGDFDEEARVAAALGYVAHMVQLLSIYLEVPLRYPLLPRSSRSSILDHAPSHHQGLEAHANRRFWGFGLGGGSHQQQQQQLGSSASAGSSAAASTSRSSALSALIAGDSSSPSRGLATRSGAATADDAASSAGSPGRGSTTSTAAAALGVAGAAASSAHGDARGSAYAPAGGDTPLEHAAQRQGGEAAAAGAPLELPLYYIAGDRTRFAYAVFLLNKDLEQLLHAHGMSSYGPNQVLANLYKLMTAAASALPPAPRLPRQPPHAGGGGVAGVAPGLTVAAAGDVGTAADWLQQLPLPPAMQQLQGAAGPGMVQQQQHQRAACKPDSFAWQQQQQQGSWGFWPWGKQQQQQQQQLTFAPCAADNNAARYRAAGLQQSSAQPAKQPQQQAVLHHDRSRAAHAAAAAANAATASAESAMAAATQLLAQQEQQLQRWERHPGQPLQQHRWPEAGKAPGNTAQGCGSSSCRTEAARQQQQVQGESASNAALGAEGNGHGGGGHPGDDSSSSSCCIGGERGPGRARSVASLLSLRWAGDA